MLRPLALRGPDDEGIALFHPEAGTAAAVETGETARDAWLAPKVTNGRHVAFLDLRAGGSDCRFEHRIALGHRRFSIIDPSPAAHQPFWSGDGSVCVTLNGEIYNYVELRAELEAAGGRFRTRSDTEVLVEAYLSLGRAPASNASSVSGRSHSMTAAAKDCCSRATGWGRRRSTSHAVGWRAVLGLGDQESPCRRGHGCVRRQRATSRRLRRIRLPGYR